MKDVLGALSITTFLAAHDPLHPVTRHTEASHANYSRIFHTVFCAAEGSAPLHHRGLFKTAAMMGGGPKEQQSRSLPAAKTETAHDVISRAPGRDGVSRG